MNIVVCMKQVPGKFNIEIDPQTDTLIRGGTDNIIGPFEINAVEGHIRLQENQRGQVGPQLAEMLQLPFVSCVSKIEEVADGHITVQRMAEEGHHLVEMQLPGVISVVKEINVPRLPSLRGLMQSKKAHITLWNARELGVDVARVGLQGSPTRIVRVFRPQRASQGDVLQGSPESQVEQLIEKLKATKGL